MFFFMLCNKKLILNLLFLRLFWFWFWFSLFVCFRILLLPSPFLWWQNIQSTNDIVLVFDHSYIQFRWWFGMCENVACNMQKMAEDSKHDQGEPLTSTDTEIKKIKKIKKHKGVLSRLWASVFGLGSNDFEKRLRHISKEEAAVLSRIARRCQTSRRTTRQFIILSVILEVISHIISYHNYLINISSYIKWKGWCYSLPLAPHNRFLSPSFFFQAIAVVYAMLTTRSLNLNWHIRALRVLPMFLLPVVFFVTYSAFRSYTKLRKCFWVLFVMALPQGYSDYQNMKLVNKTPYLQCVAW